MPDKSIIQKKEKFIPVKKFESKNYNYSKKCIERVNESERKAIFESILKCR